MAKAIGSEILLQKQTKNFLPYHYLQNKTKKKKKKKKKKLGPQLAHLFFPYILGIYIFFNERIWYFYFKMKEEIGLRGIIFKG